MLYKDISTEYIKSIDNIKTQKAYKNKIDKFLNFIGDNIITKDTIIKFIEYIDKCNYSTRAINLIKISLRNFIKYCYNNGVISSDIFLFTHDKTKNKLTDYNPYKLNTVGIDISDDILIKGIENILQYNDLLSLRNIAIICLLQLGLRREEISNLDIENYNSKSLIFKRKGNKSQEIIVPDTIRNILDIYINRLNKQNGILFYGAEGKSRKLTHNRISTQAIYKLTIEKFGVRPHDFRRRTITKIMDSMNIYSALSLSGLKSIDTLVIYDMSNKEINIEYDRLNLVVPVKGELCQK